MQSMLHDSTPQTPSLRPQPRKRGPPTALLIDTSLARNPIIILQDEDAPSKPPVDAPPSPLLPPKPKLGDRKNMKRLSLNLPSAQSSSLSLNSPLLDVPQTAVDPPLNGPYSSRPRRPSVLSLPNTATPIIHRKDEDGSPAAPYTDGPIQILPGIWLGSEDNARDWPALMERNIKSILNVAKEVQLPFDSATGPPLRAFSSTPNLAAGSSKSSVSTYYPPHVPSGRPGMYYLKLPWSHGQSDLVRDGFPTAMAFVDAALARHEGILIHCQCGISRSATLVIALVMRASHTRSASVPPEVWDLHSMQAAYAFVKEKSQQVGPNMSLIYQLLDYEKVLKGGSTSPTPSDKSSCLSEEEREWGRRRSAYENNDIDDRESEIIQQEARNLDRAMEERIIARKPSASSITSSNGVGMGVAWRSRYGRNRAGSTASGASVLSEDLVEADEEPELLGVGGGFDESSDSRTSPCLSLASGSSGTKDSITERSSNLKGEHKFPFLRTMSESSSSSLPEGHERQVTVSLPPSGKGSFKSKRRPPPLKTLPPVPPSPVTPSQSMPMPQPLTAQPRRRLSRKAAPPPLKLRSSEPTKITFPPKSSVHQQPMATTPSQTLLVFPPSPSRRPSTLRTPSTMTITSHFAASNAYPFPPLPTPRVSASSREGRARSFIGIGSPAVPTTAYSRVDARGWVGLRDTSAS